MAAGDLMSTLITTDDHIARAEYHAAEAWRWAQRARRAYLASLVVLVLAGINAIFAVTLLVIELAT